MTTIYRDITKKKSTNIYPIFSHISKSVKCIIHIYIFIFLEYLWSGKVINHWFTSFRFNYCPNKDIFYPRRAGFCSSNLLVMPGNPTLRLIVGSQSSQSLLPGKGNHLFIWLLGTTSPSSCQEPPGHPIIGSRSHTIAATSAFI